MFCIQSCETKGGEKVNLRDRPYLDVEVVEVKTKKYIPKWCRGCEHNKVCSLVDSAIKDELKYREGTWVNGENIDKIQFPCVCSYRKNQELRYGTLDKVFSDGSFGIILRELKQIKEGWYPGNYEAYYDAVDFEVLIKCWDIHIEKAKIVIFKEI